MLASSIMYVLASYIIVHYRTMEIVRQQNEDKYVAHNRVSDS